MSDPRSIRAFPTATAPLTPDAIVDTIRLTAPEGILRVQGIAENVSKPWSSSNGGRPMVFGELALGTAVLSFQVPDEAAPNEGEAVVIEGHLRFRPASRGDTRRGNWKVVLVGQVVGTWTPRARPAPIALPVRGEATPLEVFLERDGIERLLVLTTDTGQTDINGELAAARVDARPQYLKANFGDAAAFVQLLAKALPNPGISAIAVARGGGIGLDVIGGSREVVAALIETRLPFYTALGHNLDVSLLDRYAHQVFHAPTALGSAIGRMIVDRSRRLGREREAKKLVDLAYTQEGEISHQAVRINQLETDRDKADAFSGRRLAMLRNIAIGLALGVTILLWLLLNHSG